jgi:hypothetical protein
MYLQRVISRKTFFKLVFCCVGLLKVNDENRRIRIRIRFRIHSQRHGSADLDPDPHQNVMDLVSRIFKTREEYGFFLIYQKQRL